MSAFVGYQTVECLVEELHRLDIHASQSNHFRISRSMACVCRGGTCRPPYWGSAKDSSSCRPL